VPGGLEPREVLGQPGLRSERETTRFRPCPRGDVPSATQDDFLASHPVDSLRVLNLSLGAMLLRLASAVLSRSLVTAALLSLVSLAPALRAQQPSASPDTHLVTPAQLQQQVQSASAERQKNIDSLTQFLSSPMAVGKMKSEHIDPAQVKSAIPSLSDAELADLSARATNAQQQFAAGTLSNNDLLIIILILVVVILIAVIH
jgi:hypothetical protein